jgi:hypothetical protein
LKCYQCYKDCDDIHQVMVIDEVGKKSYEKVCSEECGEEVRQELYHLHKRRADSVQNQVIQRLK